MAVREHLGRNIVEFAHRMPTERVDFGRKNLFRPKEALRPHHCKGKPKDCFGRKMRPKDLPQFLRSYFTGFISHVTAMLPMLDCCSHIPLSLNMPYVLRLLRSPLLLAFMFYYTIRHFQIGRRAVGELKLASSVSGSGSTTWGPMGRRPPPFKRQRDRKLAIKNYIRQE